LRILTALAGIPAVIALIYLGSWPFALLVAVTALLAQYEVLGLLDKAGLEATKGVVMPAGLCLVLASMYPPLLYVAVAIVLVWLAASPFVSGRPARTATGAHKRGAAAGRDSGPSATAPGILHRLSATMFGVVYPSGFLAFLVALRVTRGEAVDDTTAFAIVLTTFLLVWSTDTFAYYTGRALGRRPLAPTISPKKTWAGAVGGTVGAVVVGIVMKLLLLDVLTWGHAVGVALVAAVAGQFGDLAESAMKRAVEVKDSGALLPGHGGILDRFDAMILAAPAVYLYLAFVARIISPGL